MLSSSIPVHAEEPDGSEGSTFDSSAETEDSDDGAAQEREVETNTIDIGSGDGVWDASEENNHTNKRAVLFISYAKVRNSDYQFQAQEWNSEWDSE